MKNKKSAFTLVELLATIAIIATVATLLLLSLQNSRKNARDSKRISDIKQIQTALELYFNDLGEYPSEITSTIAYGQTIYMNNWPNAPRPADGDCSENDNEYKYSSVGENNESYEILFCLGSGLSSFLPGIKIASPYEIMDAPESAFPELPGMILHLAADYITGLNHDDNVQIWFDLSGNNNHATQANLSKRPVYQENVLSGKPAIKFGGRFSQDSLEFNNFTSSLTASEIFAIIWIEEDPPLHGDSSGIWRFGNNNSNTHYPFTNGSSYLSWGRTSRIGPMNNAVVSLANPHILNISSGSSWTMRQDGVVAHNTTSNTVGFRSNPAIGESPGLNRWLNGYFAEVIMYNRVLDAGERSLVEQYLGSKWLDW